MGIQENGVYTEFNFSLKSRFTKIVLTPKFSLLTNARHIMRSRWTIVVPGTSVPPFCLGCDLKLKNKKNKKIKNLFSGLHFRGIRRMLRKRNLVTICGSVSMLLPRGGGQQANAHTSLGFLH